LFCVIEARMAVLGGATEGLAGDMGHGRRVCAANAARLGGTSHPGATATVFLEMASILVQRRANGAKVRRVAAKLGIIDEKSDVETEPTRDGGWSERTDSRPG
jgi:hypothetical protein